MSDLQTDLRKATNLAEAVAALRLKIRGEITLPGDPQYDVRRKVYNGMIDKYPALIVTCVDVADVSSAVEFGCEMGMDIAIRSSSHNGPGFGTVEGGLVIDLSRMRGIRVDPDEKTVRVEAGALLGDIDHATYPFGLAVPLGVLSTTGVGGLTLGGGMGYLTRRYGLTIDNLLSVDMVLADGTFITASKDQNEDLFWAVRGGGGNFGVITSFLFHGNPVETVYGGPMFWTLDEAAEMLAYYQDLILDGPEELSGWYGLVSIPPVAPFPEEHQGKKMCIISWCYTGPLEKAEKIFAPIRSHKPPSIDFAGPIQLPALQSMFDALYPAGLQWYWKADFFERYNAEAIDLQIKHGKNMPTLLSAMHIYPINGAASRISNADSAWGYRNANFAQVIIGVDSDPANNEKIIQWAKDYARDLHPYALGGGYINFIMDEGQEGVKAAYGENYTRLAQIKARFDPNNLFHVNQNILPEMRD